MEQTNFQQEPPSNGDNGNGGCLKYVIILFILGVIMLIAIIATVGGTSNSRSQSADSAYAAVDDSIAVDSVSSEDLYGLNSGSQKGSNSTSWEYTTDTDEMDDSKSRFASLISDNTVDFDSPYDGGSLLRLTVRHMKKYGTDVYITISRGQFICSEYEGTNNVRVRFDNGPAMRFITNEPTDGSPDVLFLNNAKKFIKLAEKAKTIKIEAPFYQEGSRVFTFTTDKPLKW